MAYNESTTLLVESRVRDYLKRTGEDLRVSGEFLDELNETVKNCLNEAVQRARGNDRKTLRPVDL